MQLRNKSNKKMIILLRIRNPKKRDKQAKRNTITRTYVGLNFFATIILIQNQQRAQQLTKKEGFFPW